MSVRMLFVLVLAVPVLIVGGAMAMGQTIPVKIWGRGYVQSFDLSNAARPIPLPGIQGPQSNALPLVVIDAGHGGRDPGSVGPNIQEKDVVLAIALRLRDLLLESGSIRVAMTREDDRLVALVDRPEIARRLDADLFLSIHADSAGDRSQVSGASIYTLSNKASSEAAARFASRENQADPLNGVQVEGQSEMVSTILVELAQGRTQDDANEFSELIQREGEGRIVFNPTARRKAALAVLRAPDVPGVLFESGFVTNREDRARLTTQEGRDEYAEVLARAIRVYFARRARNESGNLPER